MRRETLFSKFLISRIFGIYSMALVLSCAAFFHSYPTFAAAVLKVENAAFLRDSNQRVNSAYIFTVGPKFEGSGKYTEGKFDARAITFMSDVTSMTIESKNAYLATSSQLMDHNQLTLGRRYFDWSKMDDTWNYGMWSPRFMWDPLRPEQIGLTGLFYSHHSSIWRILAYASPISIPERGYPARNQNGLVESPSPYFRPLPERLDVMNASVPIYYNIKTPSYSEVLLRPAGALQVKYGRDLGVWASAGYGYMPVHQIDMAFNASLNLASNKMDVEIYPRFPMHHLVTVESGYRKKMWNLWASVSGDQPQPVRTEQNWISNSTGSAIISSAGGELLWEEGLTLHSSYVFVVEDSKGIQGPPMAGNLDLTLPSRFMYRRALQAGGKWDRGSPTTYAVNWTYDVANLSNLFSADLNYTPRWRAKMLQQEKWTFGVGADFIASSIRKGTIGQYAGDDRVRAGVSYVF